jgi:PAS domain S-box-containing protein
MDKVRSREFSDLRRRAESSLRRAVRKSLPKLTSQDVDALVHELRVHEIELELQCQELQAARGELEASHNRYRELYESVPIGYVTIDLQGRIKNLNPAGVDLLGEKPSPSLKNFNFFLATSEVERFILFCRQVIKAQKPDTGEVRMRRLDGGLFWAWLQAVPVRSGEAQGQQLRIAFKDITTRKEAEELLRRHHDQQAAAREAAETSLTSALDRESRTARQLLVNSLRLDSIVQSAMDAIITVDNQQRILLFNQAAEAMFRVPAALAIGEPIDRFIPARYHEAHREHVQHFGRSGVTSRKMGKLGMVTGLRADGTEFPVEASISQITAENNTLYTVILRDITERQLADAARQQSELRLRKTLDTMLEGCQIVGFDYRYLYVNEAAARHGRLSQADMVGRTMMDCYPGIDQAPFFGVLRRAMEERVVCQLENEFTFPDGSKASFDISVQPVPEGILILSYDITDRRHAERLIRQSEERYRRLVSVTPYAILVLRGDRLIFANDQAIKLLDGVSADDLLGKSLFDLFHPDDRAQIREQIEGMVEGTTLVPMAERKIVAFDGTIVDVEMLATSFTDDEGPAVLIVLQDISERKRLQSQLRKTERIAELGTLASGMAHEIGTPMNVILGRAEYLMDRVHDEPVRKSLKTIIIQVERITRVMNQLLSFARRKPLQPGPVELRQVIENSLEMFQERLSRQHVQVYTHIDPDCPPVHADSDQMNQVLINLIMNAIQAMPDGGTLRIDLHEDENMVKCAVADTGQGIRNDLLKKIFDPFFTTKEFGKGTGLGLTVVKGIIEEHHGSIVVESEEGKGTVFTILLPRSV